jgi:transposase
MLTAIWHMRTTGSLYNDPGPVLHAAEPGNAKDRAVHQLESMGYTVTLQARQKNRAAFLGGGPVCAAG